MLFKRLFCSKITNVIQQDEIVRLSKRIASTGYCSRRAAEKCIKKGQVQVNQSVITEVSTKVTLKDTIHVHGKQLDAQVKTILYLAHKLPGELVAAVDPKGRPTILDRLKQMNFPTQHIMPVGRLDFNTEGLLLLTNNGKLARQFELPENNYRRVYKALVRGEPSDWKFAALQRGVRIDDKIKYKPIKAQVDIRKGKDTWLSVEVREGKNREVRNALAKVKFVVKRLIRTEYGPYKLGNLSKGSVHQVHLTLQRRTKK